MGGSRVGYGQYMRASICDNTSFKHLSYPPVGLGGVSEWFFRGESPAFGPDHCCRRRREFFQPTFGQKLKKNMTQNAESKNGLLWGLEIFFLGGPKKVTGF